LVRPNDGCVEEGAGFVILDGELGEDALPRSLLGPPGEAVVHGLPATEPLGQISPRDAGPDAPDDGVDEIAVPSLGERSRTYREKAFNALPLGIAQFVSVHGEC
jgi:hypothetical protein